MGKIIACNCVHLYQDSLYGYKNRYHNSMMSKRSLTGYRCTVCGNKVQSTAADKVADREIKKEK